LLTTFGHREPDRVPIDLGATQVTGISLEACRNLFKYLHIPFSELQLCDFGVEVSTRKPLCQREALNR
jgi:hypothetical protein